MLRFIIFLIILSSLTLSCSKNQNKISPILEDRQDLEMMNAYLDAVEYLNQGDTYYAAKKFLEAELLFPQSKWAPRSVLMASYAYYLQNYYSEALKSLERFLTTYPNSKDLVYAHYLIAMCYYENIESEKKDIEPIIKAKNEFSYIVENYPNTDFAKDSQFKLDLIEDFLAAKEMYLGRHYLKKKKWVASMNRFKNVVEDYDETIFVEEALHRLVEINYNLGLIEESKKYAKILGYNYLSGEWYRKSYKIFNKTYSTQIPKKIDKDKKSLLDNFKKLFD